MGEFELSKEAALEKLKEAVIQFDINNIRQLAEQAVDQRVSPYEAVMVGMAKGMEVVGRKYQDGEYFLPELLMAAETFKEGMKILGPHLKPSDISPQGRVVIGTVEGDLHDIGKNIVSLMLEVSGFEVFDLGVDVPANRFTNKAKEVSADVIAMSALLTTSFPQMKQIIEAGQRSGIGAKILVGGAPLNRDLAKSMGADGYGRDAVEGATICKQWITAKRQTPSGR